jgi:phosphate transport system ATP-binding protein
LFNNVAFGLRLNGYKGDKAEKVKKALRGAALWDEVTDKLQKSGCRFQAASNRSESRQ